MNLLILLIGGNPIANYALIKYFKNSTDTTISSYDKVVLIYTNQTLEVSENIKSLNPDISFIDINLQESQRNLKEVEATISHTLESLKNISSIHLNYTGGTKSMSIGAFLAVSNYPERVTKIYSDISPKDYKLTLSDATQYPENGSLSSKIQIPIEDFCLLHGLTQPKLQREQNEFYSEEFCLFLLDKCDNHEQEFYIDLWDKNDSDKMILQKSIENYVDVKNISNKKLGKLQKFVQGVWLESYLFALLGELKDELKITDIAHNITLEKETKEFEVDVVAIIGYKSFLFSCTTAKKTHIKQKAFEASNRSKDLSGIAGNTILISLANEKTVDGVKQDIKDAEKKSFVFGIDDIREKERFKSKLRKILQ